MLLKRLWSLRSLLVSFVYWSDKICSCPGGNTQLRTSLAFCVWRSFQSIIYLMYLQPSVSTEDFSTVLIQGYVPWPHFYLCCSRVSGIQYSAKSWEEHCGLPGTSLQFSSLWCSVPSLDIWVYVSSKSCQLRRISRHF